MLVWLMAVLCASCSAQLALPQEDVRRCSFTVAKGMKGLLCNDMGLKEVPSQLSSSIEVLDLSSNRIRILTDASFSRYTYLRYLYLNDNLLVSVEKNVFSMLQLLEAVDLSLNALHQVPPSLLALPVLRRLYFADNLLGLTGVTGLESPPANSQLHFLSLANCGLTSFPSLQGLSKLHTLNVSGNSISSITVDDIAPLCRLQILDLKYNTPLFKQQGQLCECALLEEWLNQKDIQLPREYTLNCGALTDDNYVSGKLPEECETGRNISSAQLQYELCNHELLVQEQMKQTRKAWSIAGICIGVLAGVVLIILLIYLRRRRRRKQAAAQQASAHKHKPLLQQPLGTTDRLANGDPPVRLQECNDAATS